MKQLLCVLLAFSITIGSAAQTTFQHNGVVDNNHNFYVFKNATIYVDYQTVIDKGTLVVQDGKVVSVGSSAKYPDNAIVYDMKGKTIYPSFIDLYSDYGMPEVKKKKYNPRQQQPKTNSDKQGAFSWNEAIKPEVDASEQFTVNKEKSKKLRNVGFGAVLTHQHDGIMRGTSVLASLGMQRENKVVMKARAASMLSFRKGSSSMSYPNSLMGAIALLRQTYYDAQWHANTQTEQNLSLDALNNNTELPQIFAVRDYLSAVRADKIGDEFGIQYIIKGTGAEYKRVALMQQTGAAFILPVNYPKPYDMEDAYAGLWVTLADMKHWELAPTNAAALNNAGIPICFTTEGMKEPKGFLDNVRKAVQHGLPAMDALKALTYTPAQLLGVEDQAGGLQAGKWANFLVVDGDLMQDGEIYENWIQGSRFVIKDETVVDVRGKFDVNLDNHLYHLHIKGAVKKPKGTITIIAGTDTTKIPVAVNVVGRTIGISFNPNDEHYKGSVQASGTINFDSGSWDGNAQTSDGSWVKWNAIRTDRHKDRKKPFVAQVDTMLGPVCYPNTAYGLTEIPKQGTVLITNATVWTNEADGILSATDVLVKDGKIVQIGKGIKANPGDSAIIIDGSGKHLTSGIIDEHSHIAIKSGVNEGTQAITAEVSIADVINSDDVNIYRQLAGGVTCAQLLHGSANPIGGQSALIKLRWGQAPDSMKIDTDYGFIKFALGENVKQSNWGDNARSRYPQTRMGVEQVFYDAFIRAKAYEADWAAYNNLPKKKKAGAVAPRVDLELEALLEILNKERFISCHSYVQSEINMLMHVADSMGFTLNTFTHILEGYKVADKMKEHGAGGSTFSDWWAYKYEVNDAIPYNAALMYEQGIVVALNSDDAEMARRLNQEAAKAVKYGGVPETEAWKMVTLNPAKLLHIDDKVGSIKVGKDADLVLWSAHPMSIYAVCEMTMIDGMILYEKTKDEELRKAIWAERSRLITKMIEAKNNGGGSQKPTRPGNRLYHCDDILEEY